MTSAELEKASLKHQLKRAEISLKAARANLDRYNGSDKKIIKTLEDAVKDYEDEVWAINEDIKEL